MMQRRGFIASLVTSVLAVFGVAPAAPAPPGEKMAFRFVKRFGWAKIAWDDIKPDDFIIAIDMLDGELRSLECFKAVTCPEGQDGSILVREERDLLPLHATWPPGCRLPNPTVKEFL